MLAMRTHDDEQWASIHKLTDDDRQLMQAMGDDWHCQDNVFCGRPHGHAGDHDNYFAKQMIAADEVDSDMDEQLLPWGAQTKQHE